MDLNSLKLNDFNQFDILIRNSCPLRFMHWLLAQEDRDVTCGYVPALPHPLRKLGEEEQVNFGGEEEDIRVGEMEDHQSSLQCLCHRGLYATFWTAFS